MEKSSDRRLTKNAASTKSPVFIRRYPDDMELLLKRSSAASSSSTTSRLELLPPLTRTEEDDDHAAAANEEMWKILSLKNIVILSPTSSGSTQKARRRAPTRRPCQVVRGSTMLNMRRYPFWAYSVPRHRLIRYDWDDSRGCVCYDCDGELTTESKELRSRRRRRGQLQAAGQTCEMQDFRRSTPPVRDLLSKKPEILSARESVRKSTGEILTTLNAIDSLNTGIAKRKDIRQSLDVINIRKQPQQPQQQQQSDRTMRNYFELRLRRRRLAHTVEQLLSSFSNGFPSSSSSLNSALVVSPAIPVVSPVNPMARQQQQMVSDENIFSTIRQDNIFSAIRQDSNFPQHQPIPSTAIRKSRLTLNPAVNDGGSWSQIRKEQYIAPRSITARRKGT